MKSLYTLLAIFTVGIASAQTPRTTVAVVTEFIADGTSYISLKGGNNPEEICFDNVTVTNSYQIDHQGQGSDSDLFIGDVRYRVVNMPTINSDVSRWSFYNRIYDANGTHIPSSNLLDCPDGRAWELAPNNVQWFINSEFPNWAYNEYVENGLYKAVVTNNYRGFSAALNQEYITNNLFGDTGYGNLASLEAAIETFIASRSASADVTWTEAANLSASGEPLGFIGSSTVGAHRYEITHAIQYGESHTHHGMGYHIEGSWIYHGGPNGGGASDPNFILPIDTPTYYYYSTQGRELTDQDRATLGEAGIQTRLDRGIITILHREPSLQQIIEAQAIVRRVILDEFNRFAISQTSGQ